MYNILFSFENGQFISNVFPGFVLDINPINGYNVNWDTYTLPNGIGSNAATHSVSGIDRTVTGALYFNDPNTLAKEMNNIFSLFSEKSKGKVVISALIPSPDGTMQSSLVKSDFIVKKTPEFIKHSNNKIIFMAQIFCLSPHWEKDTENAEEVYIGATVNYGGHSDAYISEIIITALQDGLAPGIRNNTTEEYISFSNDVKLSASGYVQILLVSDGNLKATLNDGTTSVDITDKMTNFSQPIRLVPGQNSFMLFEGVKATIRYNEKYSGVCLNYGN